MIKAKSAKMCKRVQKVIRTKKMHESAKLFFEIQNVLKSTKVLKVVKNTESKKSVQVRNSANSAKKS